MRPKKYRFHQFEFDAGARDLHRDGTRVPLPPKSFDCLAYLIAHRDRAVGRDELIAAVWGRVDIGDTVVAQTMLRARKALGGPGESAQRFVRTVPRFGYHWVVPVEECDPPRAPAEDASAPVNANAPFPNALSMPCAPPTTSPRSWRRFVALGAACAIAALGVVLWQWTLTPSAHPIVRKANSDAVLVLPVRMPAAHEEDAWVRLGAMDYLANRLRRGGLYAVPSDQAVRLDSQTDGARPLDAARALRLQRLGDVRWVIAPVVEREGHGWRLRLRVFEGARERVVEVRGENVLVAAADAADSWLRRVQPDRMPPDAGPGGSSSACGRSTPNCSPDGRSPHAG